MAAAMPKGKKRRARDDIEDEAANGTLEVCVVYCFFWFALASFLGIRMTFTMLLVVVLTLTIIKKP